MYLYGKLFNYKSMFSTFKQWNIIYSISPVCIYNKHNFIVAESLLIFFELFYLLWNYKHMTKVKYNLSLFLLMSYQYSVIIKSTMLQLSYSILFQTHHSTTFLNILQSLSNWLHAISNKRTYLCSYQYCKNGFNTLANM